MNAISKNAKNTTFLWSKKAAICMEYPKSMDEVVYFTNRKLPDGTTIFAFARKMACPQCGEPNMGKPKKDDGKVKIRSPIYQCSKCKFEMPKAEYESQLQVEIEYSNPETGEKKQTAIPFKRKTWKGMKAFVFMNEFTGEKMGITKRMKLKKEKK